MADWYTRTTQGGFISSGELQACAVVDTHLRARGVTSERASATLVARSVVASLASASTCLFLGSTGFVVWRPAVAVSLDSIYLVPLVPWCSSSTAQVALQLWSCATGVVGNFNTSSTVIAAGAFQSLTINSTASTLTGTESLMAWANASSCQFAQPAMNIVVNYQTSG